jgi:hypothetical protein
VIEESAILVIIPPYRSNSNAFIHEAYFYTLSLPAMTSLRNPWVWREISFAIELLSIGPDPKNRNTSSRLKSRLSQEGVRRFHANSAYGIAQSAFADVRQRPCRAQNARNVSVSYHRTPWLFIDFAISFAINHRVSRPLSEGF